MNVPEAKAAIRKLVQEAADSYAQSLNVYWAEDPTPAWVSNVSVQLSVIGAQEESHREVETFDTASQQLLLEDSSLALIDVQFIFRSENEQDNPLALDLAQRVRQVIKRRRPEGMGAKFPSPLAVSHLPEDGRYKQFASFTQEFRYEFHIEPLALEVVPTIKTVVTEPELVVEGES